MCTPHLTCAHDETVSAYGLCHGSASCKRHFACQLWICPAICLQMNVVQITARWHTGQNVSQALDSSICTCCWAEGLPGVEKGGKMARPLTLSGLPRSLTCFSFTVPSSTICTHTMGCSNTVCVRSLIIQHQNVRSCLCVRQHLASSLSDVDSRRAQCQCLSAAIKVMLASRACQTANTMHQSALEIWGLIRLHRHK